MSPTDLMFDKDAFKRLGKEIYKENLLNQL